MCFKNTKSVFLPLFMLIIVQQYNKMAATKDISLNAIAQRIMIYHDVETIKQVTGTTATHIIKFLSETKYVGLTQKAISERHKRGRSMLKSLPIGELQFIEPFSKNEVLQLTLKDIKKAAS